VAGAVVARKWIWAVCGSKASAYLDLAAIGIVIIMPGWWLWILLTSLGLMLCASRLLGILWFAGAEGSRS
jgi:hypothetical protein